MSERLQREIKALRAEIESLKRIIPVRLGIDRMEATTRVVRQVAHGLAVKNVIRHNGTIWVQSKNDTPENAVMGGMVVRVISADVFEMAMPGSYVTGLSGLTAGAMHYLSVTAGGLTTTPAGGGAGGVYSVPVLYADTGTSGILAPEHPMRELWNPTSTLITASTSWSVPTGVKWVLAVVCAGGGGGAGGSDNITLGYVASTSGGSPTSVIQGRRSGGGGGGGAVAVGWINLVGAATLSITVGAAGTAGAVGGNGGNGGNSLAGNLVAYGGKGGTTAAGGRGGICPYGGLTSVAQVAHASGCDGQAPTMWLYSGASGGYGPTIQPSGGSAGAARSDYYGWGGAGGAPAYGGDVGNQGAVWLHY